MVVGLGFRFQEFMGDRRVRDLGFMGEDACQGMHLEVSATILEFYTHKGPKVLQ